MWHSSKISIIGTDDSVRSRQRPSGSVIANRLHPLFVRGSLSPNGEGSSLVSGYERPLVPMISSAAIHARLMIIALGLPTVIPGKTDPSATHTPEVPRT